MEGSKVRYVGEDAMIGAGALGKVLSAAGSSGQHVRWEEGIRRGQIDLVATYDLVPAEAARQGTMSVQAQFDDSLDMPMLSTLAVRDTYDEYGEDGLLNVLGDTGHLSTLAEYAEQAITMMSSHIRGDVTFQTILAQLDEPEAQSLVSRVAVNLLTATVEES